MILGLGKLMDRLLDGMGPTGRESQHIECENGTRVNPSIINPVIPQVHVKTLGPYVRTIIFSTFTSIAVLVAYFISFLLQCHNKLQFSDSRESLFNVRVFSSSPAALLQHAEECGEKAPPLEGQKKRCLSTRVIQLTHFLSLSPNLFSLILSRLFGVSARHAISRRVGAIIDGMKVMISRLRKQSALEKVESSSFSHARRLRDHLDLLDDSASGSMSLTTPALSRFPRRLRVWIALLYSSPRRRISPPFLSVEVCNPAHREEEPCNGAIKMRGLLVVA
ncbi:hypothetical protein N665_0973s0017 [Sinapis alba]|nr:hypothetical protein N665_0973s0017 [Sinapis alba]